jgi:hypothetical protein
MLLSNKEHISFECAKTVAVANSRILGFLLFAPQPLRIKSEQIFDCALQPTVGAHFSSAFCSIRNSLECIAVR